MSGYGESHIQTYFFESKHILIMNAYEYTTRVEFIEYYLNLFIKCLDLL